MALLDRLRRRPRWEDPDPKVRADAVREIPASEQDTIAQLAREDPDAHVRRAAVRRVAAVDVLARIAADDADEDVRERAAGALVGLAASADPAAAARAAALLSQPRHLLSVALQAPLPDVRSEALSRVRDARALVKVARTSADPALRLQAVSALADPSSVLEVALRSEHKDAALAALERIETAEGLRPVAEKARNKAAARRARERLGATEKAAAEEMPGPSEVGETPPAGAEVPPPPEAQPPAGPGSADPGGDAAGAAAEERSEAAAAEERSEVAADQPSEAAVGEETHEEAHEAVAGDGSSETELSPEAAAPAQAGDLHPAEEAAAPSMAPRLRPVRKERTAEAEALTARLSALVAAEPFSLRDADVALREARLSHDDLAALPPKVARHLRDTRAALFAKAQAVREEEEWRRWGNAAVQEELCRWIEALAGQADLEKAGRELRDLDAKWAEVKTVPRVEAESLRQRYQAARAPLKERLDAYSAAKAATEAENLRLKQELCARAEALADSTEWLKASEELKGLQSRWKEVGPAPRRAAEAVWKRFRAACDHFFSRRQEDLKKRKQEWAGNMARKHALCERAEALAGSTEWDQAAAEIRKLQAEWKTIGPVRRDKSEAVWQRFRKACDAFFDRYKHRDEVERQARKAERESACRELEALVEGAGTAPAPTNLTEELQRLAARARQGPALPPTDEEEIGKRVAAARDRAVAGWPESFRGTDLDPEAGRARREKLLARVEALLAQAEAPVSALSGADLARRLKEALATNTMGGRGEVEARRRAEADEVKAAQAAWRRLPALPGDAGQEMEQRFRVACDRFFRERQPPASRAR
ncbi:MAG TPA: DUF349 domain-containing protein [Vicinamibacteria bacterium]|nr:DUF349 domain-containing protein [Vicinamibacteria bacterium]